MNDTPSRHATLRMAAINALHEAEEAKRPISARADAVIAALGIADPAPPDPDEMRHALLRTLEALERRLADAPSDDPDHQTARAARAALGLPPA